MMRKILQAMRDDAIWAARIHPALFMCSYGKMSSPFPNIQVGNPSSQEPSQSALSREHIENFTKDSEVKRDFGNLASPVNQAHVKRP